jgi:hypothetical protein
MISFVRLVLVWVGRRQRDVLLDSSDNSEGGRDAPDSIVDLRLTRLVDHTLLGQVLLFRGHVDVAQPGVHLIGHSRGDRICQRDLERPTE